MTALDNLNGALGTLNTEVSLVKSGVASLRSQVSALQAQLAAASNTDPAIQAAADSVLASVAALDSSINPPAVTPA